MSHEGPLDLVRQHPGIAGGNPSLRPSGRPGQLANHITQGVYF
jgi:hypothetical protein